MSLNVEHEWDEDGQCSIAVTSNPPCWRLSPWEFIGIFFAWVGGILSVTGQGSQLAATEFAAAAEYQRAKWVEDRERWDDDVARAEMAGALEGIVLYGDEEDPT